MKCRCGGDTFVTDSRAGELNTIRRRRQCESCNKRFTTYETSISPLAFQRWKDTQSRVKRKMYDRMTPDQKSALYKRQNLRRRAREEAVASGRPVETVYKEWGIS